MKFSKSLLLVGLILAAPLWSREMLDMRGRKLVLPAHIQKVVGAELAVTYLLYSVDPALIAALNVQPDEHLRKFFRADVLSKPVIGSFGEGRIGTFNPETLLRLQPDLVLSWPPRGGQGKLMPLEEKLAGTRIPSAFLVLDTLDDYPNAYQFLGELLKRPERCAQLAEYFKTELDQLKSFSSAIPRAKRVTVYLAEGRDGLMTAGAHSVHTEAILLAGGVNVHQSASANRRGKDQISLEQIIMYDPDVIVVKDPELRQAIQRDARWSGLRAVREGRVHLVPRTPFSWLDQPPSFLRLLGAKWLAQAFYPNLYKKDLVVETQAFFKLFFGIQLSDQELRKIM